MTELLLALIFLPLLAGLLLYVVPGRIDRVRAWSTVTCLLGTLVIAGIVFANPVPAVEIQGRVILKADALSSFVMIAIAFSSLLVAVVSLEATKSMTRQRAYHACLLVTVSMSFGVVLANDLVLLLSCWGVLAVTLYLLIGLKGADSAEAAQKSLIIVGGSDALLVLGAAIMWIENGGSALDGSAIKLQDFNGYLAVICLTAAALAKAGAFPFHGWVPDCGEKAYASVSAFLPASLDKLLGIYLLTRITQDWFVTNTFVLQTLMLVGAVTLLGAVLMALVQHDLKRLLAYHAVSQVGYMIMGIATGALIGLAGALFHMLNNTLYKSCLFLGAGEIERKTGTVDLDRLGGLATRLPIIFATCLVASLSISGIPPLNGFASKWLIYQGIIESGQQAGNVTWVVWLVVAMLGSALTLASFAKVLHAAFLCKPSPTVKQVSVSRSAWPVAVPMSILAGTCIVFGIFAFDIPLKLLVMPAIGQPVDFLGVWWPVQVSALMFLIVLIGWCGYAIAIRFGEFRRCPTFIGGERMDETRITGVPVGDNRHVEVTGVDFYRTLEELPILRAYFRLAKQRIFDGYEHAGRATRRIVDSIRNTQSGILPNYLVWLVMGMLILLAYAAMGGG